MNKGLMGLERHVINDRILIFGWTIPLNILDKLIDVSFFKVSH